MNMRSGIASVRAHAENERVRRVVDSTISELADHPDQPVRVSTKIAQWVLIGHSTLISSGETYSTRVRNIGAGVKELYLTRVL